MQLRAVQQQNKKERERWKDVIDNWRQIEGQDLTKLKNDSVALKRMRKEGWETDPANFPAYEEFPGL
ncbi:uncharacterized protein IUM83_14806 [Phytophthora cinnamomi]|uniref:uncharacterized protein n=1 Tax=Phytophthora cinnamomi TaxID=4785 RepID=UPI00355A111A|nr:hypothetical protein IUM83_14806 [Phytophthora cinnamomi]